MLDREYIYIFARLPAISFCSDFAFATFACSLPVSVCLSLLSLNRSWLIFDWAMCVFRFGSLKYIYSVPVCDTVTQSHIQCLFVCLFCTRHTLFSYIIFCVYFFSRYCYVANKNCPTVVFLFFSLHFNQCFVRNFLFLLLISRSFFDCSFCFIYFIFFF